MKNIVRGLFSQKKELQLNSDTKIFLMRPGEDLFFRYSKSLDKYLGSIRDKKNWVEDEKTFDMVNDMVKAFLLYCVRQPEDYRKRLLVDDNSVPSSSQELYSDFNPQIEFATLEKQGYPKMIEGDRSYSLTPKMVLFQIILTESGWFTPAQAVEDVKTFPDDGERNEETVDSGVIRSEAE